MHSAVGLQLKVCVAVLCRLRPASLLRWWSAWWRLGRTSIRQTSRRCAPTVAEVSNVSPSKCLTPCLSLSFTVIIVMRVNWVTFPRHAHLPQTLSGLAVGELDAEYSQAVAGTVTMGGLTVRPAVCIGTVRAMHSACRHGLTEDASLLPKTRAGAGKDWNAFRVALMAAKRKIKPPSGRI